MGQASQKHDTRLSSAVWTHGWDVAQAKGWTSKDSLARDCGIPANSFGKYVSGQSIPSLERTAVLARVLGMRLSELVAGVEPWRLH